MDLTALVEAVIPNLAVHTLVAICEATGLRWGVTPRPLYFYQSPSLHIFIFAMGVTFCYAFYLNSRNFRAGAIRRLRTLGAGRSVKCPINTAIAAILIGCLATQVAAKASRPKPLIQLGWLLMPCHILTAVWVYIFLHNKPSDFGSCCYLGTLTVDVLWGPLAALASPDMGDHQFRIEGTIFVLHHSLLVLLPFYFAIRYNTLGMSWQHLWHLTWVCTTYKLVFSTPYALLTGMNLNYMLYPPTVRFAPAILKSVYYRPAYIAIFMLFSVMCNVIVRFVAKMVRKVMSQVQHLKRKVS